VGCVLLGCPAAKYVLVVSVVRPPPLSLQSHGLLSCLPSFADFVSLSLLSPHLRGFCGWMRVGGYPQDDSSIRWGSPQGRGFVCGLCSAGLPCCQVCTSCLCGRPTHPPSLYNLVDFSLVSPLLRPCSASHYTLVKSRHRHYGTVHKLSALRHSIYIIISTTSAHRYCGTVCKL